MSISNITPFMRKIIYKSLIFIALLFCTDCILGFAFDYLFKNGKGGNSYTQSYIANKCNEDIIIYGSSRANHHYIPRIFEDSLKLSSYNCGTDGAGIITMYGRHNMIKKRNIPKIIIYELTNGFDITKNDNVKYLKHLKTFAGDETIDSIIKSVDRNEYIKLKCNTFRHNSQLFSLFSNYLVSPIIGDKGYVALKDVMNYEPEKPMNNDSITTDDLKLAYLEKFILENKDCSKLIFCISPIYYKSDINEYKAALDLCKKHGVVVFEHLNDTTFIGKKEYFKDATHLNDKGATKYTNIITQKIKELLQSTNQPY